MTTQEKLIEILSLGWEIKIYARGYPPEAPQGFLPSQTVYTSEAEGDVKVSAPFCVGYIATNKDRIVAEVYSEFDVFIDILYEKRKVAA